MTISAANQNTASAGIVALNVRAFRDIDYDRVKIQYVNMKDKEPLYDPDALPST